MLANSHGAKDKLMVMIKGNSSEVPGFLARI